MQAPNEASELEKRYQQAKAEKNNGNREKARSMLEVLANQDNYRKAQLELGLMYAADGDELTAFHYVELSAKQGHHVAEFCLSNYWLQGIGTIVDQQLAFDFCKKAVDGGLNEANVPLAGYYQSGVGTPKNVDLAIHHLKMAARNNSIDALYQLGKIYFHGKIVTASKQMAILYFKKATQIKCDETEIHTHFAASFYLGRCYLTADGKNLAEANKIFHYLITQTQQDKNIRKLVSKAAKLLTIYEFDELMQSALEIHNNNLFDIYYESFEIKLTDLSASNRSLPGIDKLTRCKVFYHSLKTLGPKDLMQLAFNELRKPSTSIDGIQLKGYLNKILSYQQEEHAGLIGDANSYEERAGLASEANFYYGLCAFYGIFGDFDTESGFQQIILSGLFGFKRAQEFLTLKSEPDSRFAVSIYLKEGNHAYEHKMYHLAKFHYSMGLKNKNTRGDMRIDMLFKQAMCDWHMGYLSQAELKFSELLKQKPSHLEALDKLMECQVKNNHLDQALHHIKDNKTYLEHIKKNMPTHLWMKTLYAAYQYNLGKERLRLNDMQGGFKCFQEAIASGNQSARLELGICYFEGWGTTQNLEEAFLQFRLNTTDHNTHYYLGLMCKHGLGTTLDKRASVDYLNTFPINPLSAEYLQKSTTVAGLMELGNAACEKKMYQLALCHYLDALEKEAVNAQALLKAGICYLRLNKLNEAHTSIQQALHINPAYEEAILPHIECLVMMNNLPVALSLVEQHETIWLRFIKQSTRKEPWKKTLLDALETHNQAKIIQQEQEAKATKMAETKNQAPASAAAPRRQKRAVNNTAPHFTSGFIKTRRDDINSCENADQFLSILEKIIFNNTPKTLREACTDWFSKHPDDRDYILQKMDSKGAIFQEYKLEWEQLPVKHPVIVSDELPEVAPVEMVVEKPPVTTEISQIPTVIVPNELPDEVPVETVVEELPVKTEIPQIPLDYPRSLTLFHKPLPKEPDIKKGTFNLEDIENVEPTKPQKVVFDPTFNLFKPEEKAVETEIDGDISYREVEYPFHFNVQCHERPYYISGHPAFEGFIKIFVTAKDEDFLDNVNDRLSVLTKSMMKARIHHRLDFHSQGTVTELTLVTGSREDYLKVQEMVTVMAKQVNEFRQSCAFVNPGVGR